MESTDPDSENIFKENLYSNYYPDRPEELQDLFLHDFVANFDWYGKDSKGQRKYRKLGKPRLVNHTIFYPEKEDRERIISILSSCSLYLSGTKHLFLMAMRQLKRHFNAFCLPVMTVKIIIRVCRPCSRLRIISKPSVVEKHNDPELPGEAKSAMNDMCEINAKSNDLTLQERIAILNADQKRIFDKVAHHLLHQKSMKKKNASVTLSHFKCSSVAWEALVSPFLLKL